MGARLRSNRQLRLFVKAQSPIETLIADVRRRPELFSRLSGRIYVPRQERGIRVLELG